MKSDLFAAKVENDPHNPLFRFSLGQALLVEDRPAEAVEHLTFCANSREDWMLARILLGKALLAKDEPDAARPILKKALELAVAQKHEDPEMEIRQLLESLD